MSSQTSWPAANPNLGFWGNDKGITDILAIEPAEACADHTLDLCTALIFIYVWHALRLVVSVMLPVTGRHSLHLITFNGSRYSKADKAGASAFAQDCTCNSNFADFDLSIPFCKELLMLIPPCLVQDVQSSSCCGFSLILLQPGTFITSLADIANICRCRLWDVQQQLSNNKFRRYCNMDVFQVGF